MCFFDIPELQTISRKWESNRSPEITRPRISLSGCRSLPDIWLTRPQTPTNSLYLGRQYRLKLIENSSNKIRLWQGRLEVNTPTPFDRKQVERSISNWFRDRATIVFGERYQYWTKLVTSYAIEHSTGIELRTMSKRWGSCTPNGKIFLNPLLVSASKDCIDYAIIHELCHLRFPNHSSSFYRLLASILPDWIDRKQKLNSQVELRSWST